MLQTKALYNLLRLNAAEDPTLKADPWALEDLRILPIDDLFSRLKEYKVQLDKRSFLHFSEQCDTPEELTDLLFPDEAAENARDPFYLAVFELWRRFIPEKQSLSIFCDELDHRIALYDQGNLENDEPIQDALANLLEVFDENADSGADPEEILSAISDYCAHDLESFLYDYISDLLDSGNSLYASELIEGFSLYATEPLWFDFLRARLLAFTDIGDANLAMHRLLESEPVPDHKNFHKNLRPDFSVQQSAERDGNLHQVVKRECEAGQEKMGQIPENFCGRGLELPLLLEMLRFLSANGEHELFKMAVKKTFPLLTSQEELIDVIRWVADFYRRLDEDDKEKEVQKILEVRKAGPIHSSDLQTLQELLAE